MESQQHCYTLITGASQGIGKHLAIECAGRNMNLILVALPNTGLEDLCSEINRQFGVTVVPYEADLTESKGPERLYQWVSGRNLQVNFLINNAGIGYEGKFENLTIEFCNRLMILNTCVVVMLTRLFIPMLKKANRGRILNVSSLASFTPMPYKSMYAASKTFVYSFTRALNSELKYTNIRASVLCPGPVPTNREVMQRISDHNGFSRYMILEPQQIAKLCFRRIENSEVIIIPGVMNKVLRFMMKLCPENIQILLYNQKFSRLHNKS